MENLKLYYVKYTVDAYVLAENPGEAVEIFFDNLSEIVEEDYDLENNLSINVATTVPSSGFNREFPYCESYIKNKQTNEWWLSKTCDIVKRENELKEKQVKLGI